MIFEATLDKIMSQKEKKKTIKRGGMAVGSGAHLACVWPWVQTPVNREKQRKEEKERGMGI